MAKTDIWMPLFIGDHMANTIGFTLAEHGAYLLAQMAYWRKHGPLTDGELQSICRDTYPRVSQLFTQESANGVVLWRHLRLDEEMATALRKQSERSEAGKVGAAARWQNDGNRIATASDSQCEGNGKPIAKQWQNDAPSPSHSPLPVPPESPYILSGKPDVSVGSLQKAADKKMAEQIYQAFPRKVGKPAALKAILRAMAKIDPPQLLRLTQEYAAARAGEDAQFTPHPATWFNQERYNDNPSTWKPASAPSTNGHTQPALIDREIDKLIAECQRHTNDAEL